MNPYFFIVGAAKSGTASLAKYLDQHPSLNIVSDRLEYLGEFENPAMPNLSKEEYLSLFLTQDPSIRSGEKSVSYLYSDLARKQIKEINPNAKIIIVLRNPIKRAYSDYWHRVRTSVESLSFSEALDAEQKRISQGERFELHYANYGLYYSKVKGYIDDFGRDNVLILLQENLKSDLQNALKQIFHFLDVDDEFIPDDLSSVNVGGAGSKNLLVRSLFKLSKNKHIVAGVNAIVPNTLKSRITQWMNKKATKEKYPPISDSDFNRLAKFYRDDLEKLGELLDLDLSSWLIK